MILIIELFNACNSNLSIADFAVQYLLIYNISSLSPFVCIFLFLLITRYSNCTNSFFINFGSLSEIIMPKQSYLIGSFFGADYPLSQNICSTGMVRILPYAYRTLSFNDNSQNIDILSLPLFSLFPPFYIFPWSLSFPK